MRKKMLDKIYLPAFICAIVFFVSSNVIAQNLQSITIPLAVLDENKQFFADLKDSDVQILQGKQQLPIIYFEQKKDLKLEIVFMVDASVSQEKVLPFVKQIVSQFIDSILSKEKDRIAIVSFAGESKLENSLTENFDEAKNKLDKITIQVPDDYVGKGIIIGSPPKQKADVKAFSTSIWDSVRQTAQMNFSGAENTSKAIILLTDGVDNFSENKRKDAIYSAVKAAIPIYTIGIADDFYGGIDKKTLRIISEQTGGRFFAPKKIKDVPEMLKQIEQILRSKYDLKFAPNLPQENGELAEITIEILNPELRKRKLELTYGKKFLAAN